MNIPFSHLAQLSLSLLLGLIMLMEGILMGILRRQIVPIPSRVLFWISIGLIGKEKSIQRFAGKNTPENLHTYGMIVLFLGACVIVSCFIYLNGILVN